MKDREIVLFVAGLALLGACSSSSNGAVGKGTGGASAQGGSGGGGGAGGTSQSSAASGSGGNTTVSGTGGSGTGGLQAAGGKTGTGGLGAGGSSGNGGAGGGAGGQVGTGGNGSSGSSQQVDAAATGGNGTGGTKPATGGTTGPGSGGATASGGASAGGSSGPGGAMATGGVATGGTTTTGGTTGTGTTTLVSCPDLPGAVKSPLYTVTVNGTPLFVEKLTKFSPEMQVHYAHGSLAGSGTATVAVTVKQSFTSFTLSPKSRKLSATKSGNTITFNSGPNYLILQVDSQELLFILLDAEETNSAEARRRQREEHRRLHGRQHRRDAGDLEDPVGHQRRLGSDPEHPLLPARQVHGRRALAEEQHDDVSRLRRRSLRLEHHGATSTPAAAGSTSKALSTR